jgi:cell surface protein SprA
MPQVLKRCGTADFNEIYDTSKISSVQGIMTKISFDLVGKYSASVTSTFNIGFNVVENSVRVQLNGRELNLGADYVVDYNIGQVTIRNDAALVPGADLKITYEQNDLFSLASKTLLGLRGLYEFDKKTKLGFSLLNLNQKTLSDKVRIGEEPLNNTIYGVDFQTEIDMPIVTQALDNIISTRANSSLSLKGEFAYMNPDPNTKKSTISSDNNESIAYIDDFEGSKRTIPIGISYTSWKDLSPPFNVDYNLEPSEILEKKGKAYWYNILPSDVNVNNIWPERSAARQDQQVTVLNFGFKPNNRGMYNSAPNLEENPRENWGGMMKILSSTASNLVEENIEFIEFWAKLERGSDTGPDDFVTVPDGARIYIDIGKISEDVIPDGVLNHEDGEGSLNDNFENEDQDRGVDFLTNSNETGTTSDADKAGDDFGIIQGSLVPSDYLQINGTEGNARLTDIGRFPDSEDLNRNFTLDRLNSYFRYEVPLDTNKLLNPFIGDRQGSGWYQFKVPLKDFEEEIGGASFEIIEYIRVWTDGINEDLLIRIADFNFVGNQWRRNTEQEGVSPEDSVLTITTISIEEDPGYIQPPGVRRERDRSNPDEEIFKNEQSLRVIVNNLEDGQSREIIKNLFRPLDVFDYTEMKLFVRGDQNFESPDNISEIDTNGLPKTNVYFRFGSDNNNFYEYRQPLKYNTSAGSLGWDEISIEFGALTTIKETRNSDTIATIFQQPVLGKSGHFYGIKGNPTLTRITYFTVGIENIGDTTNVSSERLSGEFWVNELRVLGADDTPGWAYSVSTSLKLADLLTVGFNASQTDPYFHKLNDRFGSRVDTRSWSANAKLDVIKLIPANLEGSNLSVNYSHSESFKKPLYKPGTDVLVEEAAKASANPDSIKQESQTVSIKDSWTISNVKIRIPTDAWYIDDTFNNLTFGFNYSKSFSRNPTVSSQKSWVWDAKADYTLNLGRDNFFYPADIPLLGEVLKLFEDFRNVKFYYTPQSFSTNLSARRNWNFTQSRTPGRDPDIQRDFTASRGAKIGWTFTEGGFLNLGFDYDVNISSSLAHLLTIGEIERSEKDIWNDIFGGNLFGRDNDYKQSFSLKTSPSLPSIFDLNRYFKINFGYRVSYNWRNNFQQEELGRSASYNSSISSGLSIRLKSIMDPIFGVEKKSSTKSRTTTKKTGGRRNTPKVAKGDNNKTGDAEVEVVDSLALADSSESMLMLILGNSKMGLKYLLFDYEQISMNFSQTNQRGGGGLLATGTGFNNFWAVNQKDANGPSRLFMLGLSNDVGPRVRNANLQETYSQKNSLDFKTSRPLWEGAKVDINWKVGWGFNRNTTIQTDSLTGDVMITNVAATGNLDRSFFSVPLPFLNSSLKRVNELYDPEADDQTASLSNAFQEGLESFPLLSKLPILKDVAKFVPRPNWKFSWSGLEKIALFEGLAKRIRIDHAYTSSFTEGWKVNADGNKEIQTQKINYGFSPLVGMDFQFDDVLGGDVSANIKYNVKTNYDLGLATKNVTETFSKDINFTASFRKSGFDIPLFGLSLKNDLEISFSYSTGDNTVFIFEMGDNFSEKGKPQNGQKRVTLEPRIRYVMSSRVTLSLFYKRTSVEPEGASKIPPTTTNEAGLDVNISIQ